MEGTELTKQERELKLANKFDRFTSEKGETIHSYYMRFTKLMNAININRLEMKTLQVNTMFINHLKPEWSRFVTGEANNLYEDGRVVVQNVQDTQAQGYTEGKGIMLNSVQQRKGLRILNEKVEAYDSEVDDAPTASVIFMAKLSRAGSINGDEVEFPYSNQLVFVNDTYVDFLSDSNVSSDNPYADTNEDEVVQEMTSLTQNGVAILSLIENMQHKLTGCNTINLETKQVNESLTIEPEK
ncbi:hypothetical protein Tco_0378758 [Tanacetum coccineum]